MSIAQDDWAHGGDVRSCHESCDTRKPGNASWMAPSSVRSAIHRYAFAAFTCGHVICNFCIYTFDLPHNQRCNVHTTCPSDSFDMRATSTCPAFSRRLRTSDNMFSDAGSDVSFQ